MAATASPTTELTVDGDNLSIKTQTTFKTTVINFKLGEEFDEETADGRKVKACRIPGKYTHTFTFLYQGQKIFLRRWA